ncbi:MAG: glycosyltransferase family 39 protein, partial [Acidimicrobiales bacterium]
GAGGARLRWSVVARDRRWPSPGATALAAMATGVHLFVGLAMRAPIIHPEEVAHLTAARFLAGRGLAPETESFPAYGLLLAPIARLTSDPLTLWRGALAVNAVLAGITVLLVAALARRLAPEMSGARRVLAVGAAGAYPALVLWSNLAIAENLLVPAFVATVLLVWRAWESDRPERWLAAGAAAGVVAATHPRGLVVPLTLLATALLARRPLRSHARSIVATVAGAGGVLLATALVLARMNRRAVGSARADGVLDIVRDNLRPSRLADLPVEISGQLWYLTVSTWGLFPLGLVVAGDAIRRLIRRRRSDGQPFDGGEPPGQTVAVAFVGVTVLAMFLVGSLLLRDDGSLDSFVYGRAVESVLAPLLLIGLLGVVKVARAPSIAALARPFFVIGATLVGSGAVLAVGRGATEIALPVERVNVLGMDALVTWRGLALSIVVFSVAALTGAAAVLGAGRWIPASAGGLAALLFVPSVLTGQAFMVEGSRQRATERAVADAVNAVDDRLGGIRGRCVGYDRAGRSDWHRANYELFLPDVAVVDFASRRNQAPCSDLAVSGRPDFATAFPGSRRVMLENDYDQTLWVLPGPTNERLATEGWLLPERLPAPVPEVDRRYSITLSDPGPRAIALRRGASLEVEVTVTHAGREQPWPSTHGLQSELQSVRVGVRWYRLGRPGLPDGHPALDRTRVELPRTLFPGESATLTVPLETALADGVALRAGTYEARVEVVQNGVDFFRPVGPPLVLDVVVVGRIF